jgi:hypothetical protein
LAIRDNAAASAQRKKALYDSPGKMFMIFHDVVSENEKNVILSAPKRK